MHPVGKFEDFMSKPNNTYELKVQTLMYKTVKLKKKSFN